MIFFACYGFFFFLGLTIGAEQFADKMQVEREDFNYFLVPHRYEAWLVAKKEDVVELDFPSSAR